MTQAELQKLVEEVSLTYFHRPFLHQVKINKRFKTTGGRYHLGDHHLEFNQHFLVPEQHQALLGIIKHELTHYHLHLLHRGYQHRDADFKNLLQQVGGTRFAPDLGLRQQRPPKYLYQCQTCGLQYPRQRQINLRRVVCGKCRGRLKLISKKL